jgi:hypothetical protein
VVGGANEIVFINGEVKSKRLSKIIAKHMVRYGLFPRGLKSPVATRRDYSLKAEVFKAPGEDRAIGISLVVAKINVTGVKVTHEDGGLINQREFGDQ